MIKRSLRPIVLSLIVLVAGATIGCGSAPTHRYVVDPTLQAPDTPASGPVVVVTPPDARVGLRTRDIAYRNVGSSHELEYYARHFWAGTPAEMIEPLIIEALEGSGTFSAVVEPAHSRLASLRLDTEIQHFELVVVGDSRLEAHVELRGMLVDLDGDRVIATHVSRAVVESSGRSPGSGVLAIDEALAQVLADLSQHSARVAATAAADRIVR